MIRFVLQLIGLCFVIWVAYIAGAEHERLRREEEAEAEAPPVKNHE